MVGVAGARCAALSGTVPAHTRACRGLGLGRREAAKRWANYVTADVSVGTTWRYLLVSESDVETAKGSWSALKNLGS